MLPLRLASCVDGRPCVVFMSTQHGWLHILTYIHTYLLIFFSIVGSIPSRLATPCFNIDTCFRTNCEGNSHTHTHTEIARTDERIHRNRIS